jgi:hypothetical protein
MSLFLISILNSISYIFYGLAIVLILYHYWHSEIGTEEKFKTLISLFASVSIFFTIYSIYLKNLEVIEETNSRSVVFYNNSFKDFLDDTIKFFIANPKMNYYYNDLFTNSGEYSERQRNKVLEGQITILIMSRADAIIRYINEFKAGHEINDYHYDDIYVMEEKLKNILSSFFGSKLFVENWNKVKAGLNSKVALQYVKDNFNH